MSHRDVKICIEIGSDWVDIPDVASLNTIVVNAVYTSTLVIIRYSHGHKKVKFSMFCDLKWLKLNI